MDIKTMWVVINSFIKEVLKYENSDYGYTMMYIGKFHALRYLIIKCENFFELTDCFDVCGTVGDELIEMLLGNKKGV